MGDTKKGSDVSRREFIKTVGLGSAAAAGLAVAGPAAAQAPADKPKLAAMPRRKLGKTGVDVPILNLGGMFDTINNQLLLKQALNWGVNYWDTAEAYGNGMSEEGYGRFFARNPEARKDIFLVTKLVPKGGNFPERFEKSLARLKTDYVDLFFVHGVSSYDDVEPAHKEMVEKMKKAGKMKFFGFSTHTNMEDCMLAAAKKGGIDAVMITYNFRVMQTQKMQEAVAACAEAGIGLVAMKTQGFGPARPDSEAELKLVSRFLERGFTDKQAKLKAVWETPSIASICSQMPTLTILSANVAASRDATALAASELDTLTAFAEDSCAGYCAGCGSICGQAVGGAAQISDVMRCLMYHKHYGDPELAKSVFAGLPEEERARLAELDYSQAENLCPQKLAIADLMREAVELLA
jgi:uncharacterized protein